MKVVLQVLSTLLTISILGSSAYAQRKPKPTMVPPPPTIILTSGKVSAG